MGLEEAYTERYPHEVSGGECQRAAIARALARDPAVLICDEATSALDVMTQQSVVGLLRRLLAERGMACLFITHDLALLPALAHRVLVMHGGRIVEESTPAGLLQGAASPHTQELLAADLFALADEKA